MCNRMFRTPLRSRGWNSLNKSATIRPKQVQELIPVIFWEPTKFVHYQWVAISRLSGVARRRFKTQNRSETHGKTIEPLFRCRKTCSGRWNQTLVFKIIFWTNGKNVDKYSHHLEGIRSSMLDVWLHKLLSVCFSKFKKIFLLGLRHVLIN